MDAKRSLGHVIAARVVIRARAAAETHALEFAHAALALELAVVAQTREEGGVFPDVAEALLLDVVRADRQVAAREDVAGVRDETNLAAGQAALRQRSHVMAARCVPQTGNRGRTYAQS